MTIKKNITILLPLLNFTGTCALISSFYLGQDDQIKNIKILNGANSELLQTLDYFTRNLVNYWCSAYFYIIF